MPRKKVIKPTPKIVPAPAPVPVAPTRKLVPHRIPKPVPPPPPNPTVLKFQEQLVPLVEKREIIQQHVRQDQAALQQAQMTLQNDQQALQDTENAINYRLNMIAQLTGQPMTMTSMPPPMPQVDRVDIYRQLPDGQYNLIKSQHSADRFAPQTYNGPEVNLQGDPNIPAGISSIPAPQNQRYATGYVPTGPGNPRSESAVDVREDPKTREVMVAMAAARAAV